jgi:hypothetical protein
VPSQSASPSLGRAGGWTGGVDRIRGAVVHVYLGGHDDYARIFRRVACE